MLIPQSLFFLFNNNKTKITPAKARSSNVVFTVCERSINNRNKIFKPLKKKCKGRSQSQTQNLQKKKRRRYFKRRKRGSTSIKSYSMPIFDSGAGSIGTGFECHFSSVIVSSWTLLSPISLSLLSAISLHSIDSCDFDPIESLNECDWFFTVFGWVIWLATRGNLLLYIFRKVKPIHYAIFYLDRELIAWFQRQK